MAAVAQVAWHGVAWHGMWHGMAMAWRGMGMAWHGMARGMAWDGRQALQAGMDSMAWQAWHAGMAGVVWQAWHAGMAWQAWCGVGMVPCHVDIAWHGRSIRGSSAHMVASDACASTTRRQRLTAAVATFSIHSSTRNEAARTACWRRHPPRAPDPRQAPPAQPAPVGWPLIRGKGHGECEESACEQHGLWQTCTAEARAAVVLAGARLQVLGSGRTALVLLALTPLHASGFDSHAQSYNLGSLLPNAAPWTLTSKHFTVAARPRNRRWPP